MLQLFREHWPRKQKALFFVHADLVEEVVFALGLYPFGDHPEGQRLRRRDDRAYQGLRYRIEIHPRTKLLSSLMASRGIRASCASDE